MMKILVTGGTGQVGTELRRFPWPHDVEIVSPGRAGLDLNDPEAIKTYVADGSFSAVINPAAYTAVDKAESDVVGAWRVNALAAAALAEATKKAGIPLAQVSTDYVFDGSSRSPYRESDPVAPLGVYGASKEAGEQAVRTANPRHVILRTAWVFSPHGNNFVKTMLRLAADRPILRVVDDQRGSPTAAKDIAAVLAAVTLRLIADETAPTGTYHFVNAGEVSWCGFAREIFRQWALAGHKVPDVEPIGTADYPTPARRPAYSGLSTQKLTDHFGITPRKWQDALNDTLSQLRGN
jgi:dTDP-4-dehydrorhamnose reductase